MLNADERNALKEAVDTLLERVETEGIILRPQTQEDKVFSNKLRELRSKWLGLSRNNALPDAEIRSFQTEVDSFFSDRMAALSREGLAPETPSAAVKKDDGLPDLVTADSKGNKSYLELNNEEVIQRITERLAAAYNDIQSFPAQSPHEKAFQGHVKDTVYDPLEQEWKALCEGTAINNQKLAHFEKKMKKAFEAHNVKYWGRVDAVIAQLSVLKEEFRKDSKKSNNKLFYEGVLSVLDKQADRVLETYPLEGLTLCAKKPLDDALSALSEELTKIQLHDFYKTHYQKTGLGRLIDTLLITIAKFINQPWFDQKLSVDAQMRMFSQKKADTQEDHTPDSTPKGPIPT